MRARRQLAHDDGGIDGYTASNSVSAVSDVGEAGSLIDAAVEAGANSISGPGLSSSSSEELYRQALAKAVSEVMPIFGFYLQPAVGGRVLPYSFWRRFAEIPGVVGIKMAPFNRYQTIDVLRAVAESGRASEIALYTGEASWDGGGYRYFHRDADSSYGFRGVFHSMAAENMVQTFEFDGAPGHVSLDTQKLVDIGGGRSRLTSRTVFQTVADRDAMAESGMAEGVEDGYNRLDELLLTMAQPVAAG